MTDAAWPPREHFRFLLRAGWRPSSPLCTAGRERIATAPSSGSSWQGRQARSLLSDTEVTREGAGRVQAEDRRTERTPCGESAWYLSRRPSHSSLSLHSHGKFETYTTAERRIKQNPVGCNIKFQQVTDLMSSLVRTLGGRDG